MLTFTRRVGESFVIGEAVTVTRVIVDGHDALRYDVPGFASFVVCSGAPRAQMTIRVSSEAEVRRVQPAGRPRAVRVYEPERSTK